MSRPPASADDRQAAARPGVGDGREFPERTETDESLQTERDKTDLEMARKDAAIEKDAEAVIADARERADGVLEVARDKADARLEAGGASDAKLEAVARQRSAADAVLEAERLAAAETLKEEGAQRERALRRLLRDEREETDERLNVERARADHALGTRDDFLGMVSHDLRTMLGGIALSASAVARAPNEETTVREMARIGRFVARMTRLISDLLDVVSMDGGKLKVVPVRHDAAGVLAETVEAFEPAAKAKGISMSSSVAGGALIATFDDERILQVLGNLVSNALKFTETGGRIELHVERTEDHARFSVLDTGVGVPEEMVTTIFDRFAQAARLDRRGLGLGLYVSRCIVEAHGGRIWVESRPAGGSAFHFTIPDVKAETT